MEEHEAIRTFSPIVRESVTLLDVLPGDSATLMAVDPKVLPDIVWFREDFAGKSLSELMELLRPVSLPSSSFGSGILVPGDATRIGVWVDLTGLNSGTLVSDLNLWTRIYTSQGIFHNLFLGEVSKARTGLSARNASETGAESGWTYLEEEVKDTVNPSGEPLRLVSFYLSRKSFARTPPGTISLDDVTVKGPSSPPGGLVVEDFESSGGWAPLVNQGQAPDVVERATTAARSGNAGLRFTWEETFKDAPRGVVVPPDPFPLPAIGGPNFSVGQIVRVKAGRKLVPVVIRGTTDYFPTLNALTRPFMIVPLEPYKQYVRRTSLERVKEPNAFWASVQDDADRVQVVASLHERIGAFVSIKDRDLLVETARRNPLAGGGWNGLTFLSMTAITVAVLLTLVIHSLVAIHTGRVDLAVARTLGFSRLQLALSLALERGLTAIFGLVVGSVVGIWLSRWVLGFMDIDARGRPIIPPMVLEVQDGLVVGALGGLIAATLLGLLVAVVFVRRLNVPDVLRTGE